MSDTCDDVGGAGGIPLTSHHFPIWFFSLSLRESQRTVMQTQPSALHVFSCFQTINTGGRRIHKRRMQFLYYTHFCCSRLLKRHFVQIIDTHTVYPQKAERLLWNFPPSCPYLSRNYTTQTWSMFSHIIFQLKREDQPV